jgi:hypothetical protein
VSTATTGLPAYTGPDGHCPQCGIPGAMTEWHWAVPPEPRGMAGRRPPCAGHAGLAVWDGQGQHLCRVCLNCGYGWAEACTRRTAPPGTPVPPAAGVGLFCLAASVVSTGAGSFLSPLLAGTALVAAWLAVTLAVAVAAGAGYAAAAGRAGKEPGR